MEFVWGSTTHQEGKPQKKKKKKHTANRREVAKTTNLAELGARMPLARHTTKKAAPIAPIDEEELHWMMTHKQLIEELQELDFDDFVRHQVKERFYGLKVDRRREAMIRYICIYGGDAGARRMINLKISQKLGIKWNFLKPQELATAKRKKHPGPVAELVGLRFGARKILIFPRSQASCSIRKP